MNEARIYILIDPLSQEIRYVGWTVRPLEKRLAAHLREANQAKHHRACWIASLARSGQRPVIREIMRVPQDQWADAERYWIAYFREQGCPLVNGTDGGEGTLGQRHTPETRAKMSAAKKGRPSSRKGIAMSDAQKKKLSEAAKRQMADPAARAAVSRVHSGKTISKSHREAVSEGNRRRWARQRQEAI